MPLPDRTLRAFGLTVLLATTVAATPLLRLTGTREPGEPARVSGQVFDAAGAPIARARLHVYQTDARGHYTPARAMDEPHARLSGWLTCDDSGRFELATVRPGGYPRALMLAGRERHIPAHVHLDLTVDGRAGRHWQMVFDDDTLLTDPHWRDWVARLRQPVAHVVREHGVWRATVRLVDE